MKIILDQIEFLLPEAIFKMVSNSHLSGRVKKANEVNKNIWNYQIKFEDAIIECEIKYGKNQVNRINCACGRANVKHPCLHAWIAAYWHYQEVVLNSTHDNEKKISRSRIIPDFENLDISDLSQFIILSLKLDKNLYKWSDVLLAKLSPNESIYTFLIEKLKAFEPSIVQTLSNTKLKYYKEQSEIILILYDKSVQEFIDGQLENAYFRCLACIIKSNEWLKLYSNNNHAKLLKTYINLHKAIEQIYKSIKSPELLEKIFQFTVQLLQATDYNIRHRTENLYSIFFNYSINKANKKITHLLIQEKLKHQEFYKTNEVETLHFIANNMNPSEFLFQLQNHLKTAISTQSWLIFLQSLQENDLVEHYVNHLDFIIQEISHREVQIKAAEALLEFYILNNQIEKCKTKSWEFAIQFSRLNFAKIYFDKSTNLETDAEEFIHAYIEKYKKLDNDFIFELLIEIDETELLANQLLLIDKIETFMKFDKYIIRAHRQEVLKKYLEFSNAFLLTHVGQQAYIYIDNIKKHLSSISNHSFAEQFLGEIQIHHPERTKLINYS